MPIETQPQAAEALQPEKLRELAQAQRRWRPAGFRPDGDEQARTTERLNSEAVKQLVARGHDLIQMNLYGITLEKAMLKNVDCLGADLRRANLRRADLTGARLLATKLEQAQLQQAILHSAVLAGAQLRQATLTEANLCQANLRWCNLQLADLSGAHLQNANLAWADLQGANLRGARLTGVLYNHATQWPAGFDPTSAGCISIGNN